MIWFMISEKAITRNTFLHYGARKHRKSQQGIPETCPPEFPILSALKLPWYRLMAFIDINTYMVTKDQNFKKMLERQLCNYLLLIY